jgi:hypothetical protein
VVGDANEALGEGVRFMRHVVMLLDEQGGGESLVVLDQLDLPAPERVDLFWHTAGGVNLSGMSGEIVGRQASVNFQLACNLPAEVEVTSRQLERHAVDRAVHLTAGMVGRNVIASCFSRKPISELLLEQADRGDVTLTLNGRALEFRAVAKQRYLTPQLG